MQHVTLTCKQSTLTINMSEEGGKIGFDPSDLEMCGVWRLSCKHCM